MWRRGEIEALVERDSGVRANRMHEFTGTSEIFAGATRSYNPKKQGIATLRPCKGPLKRTLESERRTFIVIAYLNV